MRLMRAWGRRARVRGCGAKRGSGRGPAVSAWTHGGGGGTHHGELGLLVLVLHSGSYFGGFWGVKGLVEFRVDPELDLVYELVRLAVRTRQMKADHSLLKVRIGWADLL